MLSDELDDQAINGAGGNSNADLKGIFNGLTDPSAPGADVATFDTFVDAFAGGIEGLWASRMNEVAIVCGPDTYRLSAKSFRDVGTNNGHRGDIAFADYAMAHTAGWWTNKRMPDKAAHIQQAILHRQGRSGMRDGGLPALERGQHRRHLLGQRPGRALLHDARPARRRDPGAAGRLRAGELPGLELMARERWRPSI